MLHGLEVLEALANYWKSGGLRLVKPQTGVGSGDLSEFESVVKLFLDRINFRFNERYRFRVNELYEVTRDQSLVYTPLSHRLRSPILRVLGVQGLVDYESFLTGLPRSVRERMEVESVNLVQELFVKKGCRVLEVNIGVYKSYDLLVECPCDGGFVKYMVEVKSHLKRILVAELTPSETRVVDENPRNYIVCNVSGLESDDKSTWIILCDLYENAKKRGCNENEGGKNRPYILRQKPPSRKPRGEASPRGPMVPRSLVSTGVDAFIADEIHLTVEALAQLRILIWLVIALELHPRSPAPASASPPPHGALLSPRVAM